MIKITIILLITYLFIAKIDSLTAERHFNFKPVRVASRDPISEKSKFVSAMATILWNKKNPHLINYFKATSVLNATEQLDTSGLYNFYITLSKTPCLKSEIKNWDLVEAETQHCMPIQTSSITCPVRVLYKPWSQGNPVKLVKPIEEKTNENTFCFLPEY